MLQERWEKKTARLEAAEARIASLRSDLDAAKANLGDRDEQIAALSNSHKATQLKLDQVRRQNEDLQASLSERSAKLKELQALVRDRETEKKSLEAQLKRVNGAARPAKKSRSGR
jgi:chromosome segregation ATPase